MNISRFTPPISARRGLRLLSDEAFRKLHGARFVLLATLLLTFSSLFFASCNKDNNDEKSKITCVDPAAVSYYMVSENELITFSSQGIIDIFDHAIDSPVWVLSYEEIAKCLGIDLSQVKTIHITRDCILDDGLWCFAVAFDGQEKGSEYGIDVDPKTGDIMWTHTLTEMPKGVVTLKVGF